MCELAEALGVLSKGVQDNGLLLDLRDNAAALTWRCGKYQEAASLYEDALRRASRTNCRLSPQYGLSYEGFLRPELACILQCSGSQVVGATRFGESRAPALRHQSPG